MLFELPHATAQRRLSNTQPLCGAPKIERFSDSQKGLKPCERGRIDNLLLTPIDNT